MGQLEAESNLGWIKQHIQVQVIFRESMVVIGWAKESEMSNLSNRVTGIMHLDSIFLEVAKIVLNFAIAFKKIYKEKFVVARVVYIKRGMMSFDFLTQRKVQCYYRYKRIAKMATK